jgi:predicted nucleic acid-binding protein
MNVEAGQIFVDTSILVYAHDRSAGEKCDIARKLVEELWASELGCLSLQVLQEFYVNITHKIPKPLARNVARQIISDLAHWQIHIPEVKDVLHAIDLQDTYSLSFWDAMVVQSAARLGCKRLVSEDLSHGLSYAGVLVVNPFKATD